jgi:hypothetical protein
MKKMLLTLSEDLIEKVKEISQAKTKSKAVTAALEEFIESQKLNRLVKRFGKGFGLTPQQFQKLRK